MKIDTLPNTTTQQTLYASEATNVPYNGGPGFPSTDVVSFFFHF